MSFLTIITFLVANFLALFIGISIVPAQWASIISTRITIRLLIFLNVIIFTTWISGFFNYLNPFGILITLIIFFFYIAIFMYEKSLTACKEFINDLRVIFLEILKTKWVGLLFLLLFASLAFRHIIHILFWPPYIWDVLTYHLPKVAEWTQTQSLLIQPTPVARIFWPSSFELLQTWFVVFFKHDIIIEFSGVYFAILSTISVYIICISLKVSRKLSILSAFIFATTPGFAFSTVSAKNDIAIAGLFLLIIAFSISYYNKKITPVAFTTSSIIAFIMAIGIKPYIIFMAPGILLLWIVFALAPWLSSFKTLATDHAPDNVMFVREATKCRRFTNSIIMITMAMLPASYWYVRNLIIFNNPFYPVDIRFFGRLVFGDGHGYGQQGTFKISSLMTKIDQLLQYRLWDHGLMNNDLPSQAGWGWFAISMGLPCLVIACIKNKQIRWLTIIFTLSFCGLMASVDSDPWYMRFAQWVPALFAVAFGVVIFTTKSNIIRFLYLQFGLICAILNMFAIMDTGYFTAVDWRKNQETPLLQRMTHPDIYEHLQAIAKPGERIGYILGSNDWIYPLYGPFLKTRIVYLDNAKNGIAKDMIEKGLCIAVIRRNDKLLKLDLEAGILHNKSGEIYHLSSCITK